LKASLAVGADEIGVLQRFQVKGHAIGRLADPLGNLAGAKPFRFVLHQQAENRKTHRRSESLEAGDDAIRNLFRHNFPTIQV